MSGRMPTTRKRRVIERRVAFIVFTRRRTRGIVKGVCVLVFTAMVVTVSAFAQTGETGTHDHALAVNAVTGGLPYFCAEPTAVAVTSGRWSNPATWSTSAVPGRYAKVLIAAGREIVYDVESD